MEIERIWGRQSRVSGYGCQADMGPSEMGSPNVEVWGSSGYGVTRSTEMGVFRYGGGADIGSSDIEVKQR